MLSLAERNLPALPDLKERERSSAKAFDPSVYAEIIKLLRDEFSKITIRRPGFSSRAYAKMLGLNPTQLMETLNGKRKITCKIAARVFERLGVEPEIGRDLLERLPEKQVRKRLASKPNPVLQYIQLTSDEFRTVSEWYHFAILSLVETKGFKGNPEWIAKRLGISAREANSAVERLVRQGLLEKKPGGKIISTGKQFSTTNDIPDASIRRNHAQGLEQAREALEGVPVELREISAIIIAADPKLLSKAKERLRAIKREIAEILEGGEKKEVYRLSIQLFPVSKSVNKNKKESSRV